MIDFSLSLSSERLILRVIKGSDFEKFLDLTDDKSMWIYFTSDLSNKNELRTWVSKALLQHEKKTRLPFTIIEKNSNEVIGSTSFLNFSERDKRIEIGATWIGKKFQGTRMNDEAKYLMLKYCFESLELERVEFKTDVLNSPARKALLRIGAVEEGILRSHTLMTYNRRRDTIYYSVLKNEWEKLKAKNVWS